jgi:hypothetical protein
LGILLYRETKCCRLKKTTTQPKIGAQSAQTSYRIESVGLIVGRFEIHKMPMAAQCSKWSLDSSWTPRHTTTEGARTVSL